MAAKKRGLARTGGSPSAARAPAPPPARKRGSAPEAPSAKAKVAVPASTKAPAVPPPRNRKLVAVAEVARPHGIVGEVRLKVYNLDSDLLARRPPVILRLPDGTEREATLTAARETDKALLVRIGGVDDRNAAEALRGAQVCVPRTALPPPDEGEFYTWDLEGAQVVLTAGETVGQVLEVTSYPTCDVLVVVRPDGTKLEVPLVATYVARVDAERGVIELNTVDGLD
jgi:16S rRNA processing protein RimM